MSKDTMVISATGMLAQFNQAGVLGPAEVQIAQTTSRLVGVVDERVSLAMALAVRQLQRGSACVDLTRIREDTIAELTDPGLEDDQTRPEVVDLPWPEATEWLTALSTSGQVGDPSSTVNAHPFRLSGSLLYLERWWAYEQVVAEAIATRRAAEPPLVDPVALEAALDGLFRGEGLAAGEPDLQRAAAKAAALNWTSVIAGGPGTGKTTTVAALLAALAELTPGQLTIALAAPSGKAATRLEQSVRSEAADGGLTLPLLPRGITVHRLLGYHGAGGGFTRSASNPLPQDVVVLDEVSMLDLPLFAQLLSALRPSTRLIMVGDPHQLSSVDAGKVLADLAQTAAPIEPARTTTEQGTAHPPVAMVELLRNWRNAGGIARVAAHIREGNADAVIAELRAGGDDDLVWVEQPGVGVQVPRELTEQVITQGTELHRAGRAGDAATALAALDQHRILCAHREGRFGVSVWSRWAFDLLHAELPGFGTGGEWYPGRPILAGVNNREIDVSNGDAGVIVQTPAGPRLALGSADGFRLLAPSLVDGLSSLYAMTVHKSQGSQFTAVTVVLPPAESPLLTRELLYTAVTRARSRLRILAGEDAIRTAVERGTQRVSGLVGKLRD